MTYYVVYFFAARRLRYAPGTCNPGPRVRVGSSGQADYAQLVLACTGGISLVRRTTNRPASYSVSISPEFALDGAGRGTPARKNLRTAGVPDVALAAGVWLPGDGTANYLRFLL